MKGLFKLLVFAGLIGVVVVVAMRVKRKPRAEPRGIRPTPWEPPVVVPPAQPTAERVAVSEEEGMQPPPEEPAGDVPRDSQGEPIVSELAAPGAPEAVIEEAGDETPDDEETRLSVADEEGMAPPAEETEDVAVSSSGTPVVSELASPGLPEVVLESTEPPPTDEERVAEDEGMTSSADGPAEDVAVGSSGEPLVSELAAPGAPGSAFAAAESLDDGMPDFSALLEEAEDLARGEAWLESVSEGEAEPALEDEEAGKEPDFLTKYFDELAATPDEAIGPEVALPADFPPIEPADSAVPRLHAVEEALDDLEPAAIVPPPRRTAESYLDEGNVYFNVGQYGLAIERYGQAVALDDTLTAAFYNRANAHTRAGDFEKALADYDRALELQPADADALNNRGMLHLYRANYSEALRDFNGALTADPTDTTVMVNRGLARLHGGDSAAALEDFREAAQMDDGDAAAEYGAAQAAASMGNKEEALRHVSRALELDAGYAREAAGDPRLSSLQGDDEFLRLLRQSGSRASS